MERAVTRGRQRQVRTVVRRIGVDEKAVAKGHRYLTLVCDVDEGTVEHIAEGRIQESLAGYYAGLTQEQRTGIEAVAMDMWEPYIQATRAQGPEADEKIVFDRFHVMGRIGKAVDTIRKQEHRDRMASGEETLKGRKYLWLYRRENLPERRRDEFAALMPRNSRSDERGPSKRRCAPVAVCGPGLRLEVLEAVVLLGYAQPTGAETHGRRDDSSAHRQHCDLLPSSGD